jgi:hypothetical protein
MQAKISGNLFQFIPGKKLFCNINHTDHKKNDLLKAVNKDITQIIYSIIFLLNKIIVFLKDV